MKPITLALGSALLASAVTTGIHALWLGRTSDVPVAEVTPSKGLAPVSKAAPEAVQPAAMTSREQELLARLDDLERSMARLDEDLLSLSTSRAPAGAATAPLAAGPAPELMREVAHQVLAEKEASDKATQLKEQIDFDRERALRRAEQIAEELGLSSGDQEQLALVYEGEAAKRRELMAQLGIDDARAGRDFMRMNSETRDLARAGFSSIREWRNGELVARLGSSVADQIRKLGSDRRGGGGFGGFGGGGGNGPGGNGPGGPGGGGN